MPLVAGNLFFLELQIQKMGEHWHDFFFLRAGTRTSCCCLNLGREHLLVSVAKDQSVPCDQLAVLRGLFAVTSTWKDLEPTAGVPQVQRPSLQKGRLWGMPS